MAYTIQWRPDGAVKYFSGVVTFDDIITSECAIAGHPSFTSLKYVISVFLNTQHPDLSDAERLEVRAQRAGGFYTNPRIKYAFVTTDERVKDAIESSVIDGQTLHPTRVFKSYEEAVGWVVRTTYD